jgi:RNA polymerase sigma-70 factor (ECF subfamily)
MQSTLKFNPSEHSNMSDEKAMLFEQHRRTLEGIAYRMLGTLADAGDVVQDTYLK